MTTIIITAPGGTRLWNDTATWSGGVIPTSSDDVIAAANSANVIVNITANCRSIDLTGYANTINGTGTLKVGDYLGGNLKMEGSLTFSMTGDINLTSNSGPYYIAVGGKTIQHLKLEGLAGNGGSWILQNTLTLSSSKTLTQNAGTLNTNGFAVRAGGYATLTPNAKSLILGSSNVFILSSFPGWSIGGSNLTFDAGMSTLDISGTNSFAVSNLRFNTVVSIPTSEGNLFISGNTVMNTLILYSTGTNASLVSFPANGSLIVNTFTANGSTNIGRIYIHGSSIGFPATIQANVVSLANCDFRDVTCTGAGTWSGVSIGNAGGNLNLTADAPGVRYWVGNGGSFLSTNHWANTSGGANTAPAPLPQDLAIFDGNSFASSNTIVFGRYDNWPSINALGITVSNTQFRVLGSVTCGDFRFANTCNISGNQIIFANRGRANIDANLVWSSDGDITFNGGTNAIYQLANNLYHHPNKTMSLTSGTFNANNFNVSVGNFQILDGLPKTLNMGNGSWTVLSAWTMLAGSTFNPNNSTVIVGGTFNTARFFSGAGYSFNNLVIDTASTANVSFSGANTLFNNVSILNSGNGYVFLTNDMTINSLYLVPPRRIRLSTNKKQTINTIPILLGNTGNTINIDTTTSGTKSSISCPIPGFANCDFLVLKDVSVTGNTIFYAGANSTNVSGNFGWRFNPRQVDKLKGLNISTIRYLYGGSTIANISAFNSVSFP